MCDELKHLEALLKSVDETRVLAGDLALDIVLDGQPELQRVQKRLTKVCRANLEKTRQAIEVVRKMYLAKGCDAPLTARPAALFPPSSPPRGGRSPPSRSPLPRKRVLSPRPPSSNSRARRSPRTARVRFA